MKKLIAGLIALIFSLQTYAATDYTKLQELVLKFYGYQRAGLKSGSCNNLNSGFTSASHNGDAYNNNPLDGGWYDAGDYIKFGMNMSYSLYCLLKGYDIFPSGYSDNYDGAYKSKDNIPDVLNEAKVGTDWLLKAVIDESTVVLDVGIASEEHSTWGVTNASGRTGSKIVLCDGGDIPATYAACLALMSVLYKKYDADYSAQCLAKAKVAFTFAKNKINAKKEYCTAQTKAGAALYDYPTVDNKKKQQVTDRMAAAGVELYRATNNADPIYRTWAAKSIGEFSNCMGYAFVGPLAAFEVWRQGLGGAGALNTNISFCDAKIITTSSNQFYNVYQNSSWGTARDVGTVAMEFAMAYVVSSNETSRASYLTKVKNHIGWTVGEIGKRSYVCGFNSGPSKCHYRTTSYGAVPGGVVSGPKGLDDNWSDDGTPDHSEVAVDYNAGLVGACAFMRALSDPGDCIKISTAFSATPKANVDFTSGSVTLSATLSKSAAWTVKIIGSCGSKVITGTGTSVSAKWDGSADAGQFLGSESVNATLSVDGSIVAYDLVKAAPIPITIAKAKKVGLTDSDVLIDDFQDNDLKNKVGGTWEAAGSKIGFGGTTAKLDTVNSSGVFVSSGSSNSNDYSGYTGVKTTFNEDGSAVDKLKSMKSVIFDLMSTKNTDIYVELEQESITDGAYFSAVVPGKVAMNTYRVNIEDFKQPDWKKSEGTLDLTKIKSLRFTCHDSVGSISITVDNVAINSYATPVRMSQLSSKQLKDAFKPVVSKGVLSYNVPVQLDGIVNMSVYNMAGKVVMRKSVPLNASHSISLSLEKLPAGTYAVSNSINGEIVNKNMKFVLTK